VDKNVGPRSMIKFHYLQMGGIHLLSSENKNDSIKYTIPQRPDEMMQETFRLLMLKSPQCEQTDPKHNKQVHKGL